MIRTFKTVTGVAGAACLAISLLLAAMATGAMASGSLKVCVQEKEGGSIKVPLKEGFATQATN